MAQIDWSRYQFATGEKWAELLKALVARANGLTASDLQGRRSLLQDLTTFIRKSPFHVASLDRVADKLIEAIHDAAAADYLNTIAGIAEELEPKIDALETATADASAVAAGLTLGSVQNALGSVVALRALFDKLKLELDTAADGADGIEQKINAALTAIAAVEAAIKPS